jgi:hypothetical protein
MALTFFFKISFSIIFVIYEIVSIFIALSIYPSKFIYYEIFYTPADI